MQTLRSALHWASLKAGLPEAGRLVAAMRSAVGGWLDQTPAAAATGTYSMVVGVFSPGWGTLYNWNGTAGSFGVTTSAVATSTGSAR